MDTKYSKGSEWRKWDLHVHTPKSIIQNYGGDTEETWNAFIQKLASLPSEIKVIGITDYLFCDGYEHLLTRRSEIPNIELIIPNIEFRLNTFSGTPNHTKRHNFHVLFDPSVAIEVIREQLFSGLSTGYKIQDKDEWQQTPTVRSLEELGRQMKAAAPAGNSVHSKPDLEVGFDNITYKREDIEKLLEKSCFKGKYITAVGYSEWDQSRWNQAASEKRTLINSAHFSLTSSSDPVKIEENRKDLVDNRLNSLVLHSSDSHELSRVGKTLLWVKADPTFAGLKQVLNEPEARVFIGTTPPNYKLDHKVISRISIPSSNGWFADDFSLELNRDLVTIIGGRGSGKSALAEAIACGVGSKDESEDAFLKKATKHKKSIKGTSISIDWSDGANTEFKVGDLATDQELVRYLPQGVVEELCSHKNSDKLQEQIENVIFQALDETERMGSSDFDELRSQALSSFQYEKKRVVEKIRDINQKLSNLSAVIAELPERQKTLTNKKEELVRLSNSLPELPAEDKKGQEDLAALNELKKRFESKIIELQSRLGTIIDVETKVKVFKSQIEEYREETNTLLHSLGIAEKSVFDVEINEDGINALLAETKQDIATKLKILREGSKTAVASLLEISENDLLFDNLRLLNQGIDDKQKETRAFETIKIKYQQQKKTTLVLESSIKALEGEIDKIKNDSAPEKKKLEDNRLATYLSYFKLLGKEKIKIEELYKPLQESLLAGTDTDKKLVFEARIKYHLDRHAESGLDIIDRTRRGNFREIDSLTAALTNFWDECSRHEFDGATIKAELNKILDAFMTFDGKDVPINEQLRENYQLEDFYNWLFDTTNFEIVSSLQFDDTDLYVLSPGQKGIILLMLFLEIDKADDRPLIIDQPEENLDNLSVYKDLIKYFRDRKQYRQIIMVTHNPNLVVNTDAEQVIVANYNGKRTPRLEYSSGSLEDQAKHISNVSVEELEDGIIEQVCNILEGGERAFESRKKKYQISTKSKI